MAKDYSKKIQSYTQKGYSKSLLDFVSVLDPGKYFNWFVESLKKFIQFDADLLEKCKIILNFFQKGNYKSDLTFEEALTQAIQFRTFEESYSSKVLYEFENGYHIYLLSTEELYGEGNIMSNCLGSYKNDIKNGNCAILALRDKNKKSILNFQILSNGSLAQNFEKGNRQVKYTNWKYINEFFNKFNKDLSKIKGINSDDKFTTLTLQGDNFKLPLVAQGIPTSIKTFITEDGEIKTIVDSFNFTKIVEGTSVNDIVEFGTAEEINKKLDELKERLIQAIDRLKIFVSDLDNSNLFLNDEIKRKIFGEKFSLKGEINSISQIISSYKKNTTNRRNAGIEDLLQGLVARRGEVEEIEEEEPQEAEEALENPQNVLDEDTFGNPDEELSYMINERFRQIGTNNDEKEDDPDQEARPIE